MNVSKEEILAEVTATLGEARRGEDAPGDATEIVRVAFEVRPEDPREQALEWARKRASGVPLAYVTGRTRFMGIELGVEAGALIPRPETELLGRSALQILTRQQALTPRRPLRIIDMCCGAGNLACALATKLPGAMVWASDLTSSCVQTARQNVLRLGLAARVQVFQGNLFSELERLDLAGTIDVVVCNPPYISSTRLGKDRASLLTYEPREAFDGGPYGLSIHQRVIASAQPFLCRHGVLLLEFGLGQARQLELLFDRADAYQDFQMIADATGSPRVAIARLREGTGAPEQAHPGNQPAADPSAMRTPWSDAMSFA